MEGSAPVTCQSADGDYKGGRYGLIKALNTEVSLLSLHLSRLQLPMVPPENLIGEKILLEQVKRYDDDVMFMEKFVGRLTWSGDLTTDERIVIEMAYMTVIGALRVLWKIVSSIKIKEEYHHNNNKEHVIFQTDEIMEATSAILMRLDYILLPLELTPESNVYFLKMKADFNRCLVEFKVGDQRKKALDDTIAAYKAAQDAASQSSQSLALPLTDLLGLQLALQLALQFSDFYTNVLNLHLEGCRIVKQALDEAYPAVQSLDDESYNEIFSTIRILLDNIILWNQTYLDDITSRVRARDAQYLSSTGRAVRTSFH